MTTKYTHTKHIISTNGYKYLCNTFEETKLLLLFW